MDFHGWVPPEGMYGFTKDAFDGVRAQAPVRGIPMELPGGGRPNANFRYAFAEKMNGWDVWAFQVALNSHQATTKIAEDGFFGPITKDAVKQEQGRHHLTVDGVAGPITQNVIATAEAKIAEVAHSIPVGLLKGIALGESGLFFAAVSGPNWNDSYDAGITQDNLTSGEQQTLSRWRYAFQLKPQFNDLGDKLRTQYDAYIGRPGAATPRDAWFCAILYHNWPAAADKTAAKQFDSWRYFAVDSTGVGRYYGVDEPAYWVIQASGGRLRTAREWRDAYVSSKTIYVKSWV